MLSRSEDTRLQKVIFSTQDIYMTKWDLLIKLVLIIFADEYQSYLSGLQDTINEIQKDIGKRMYEICMRGKLPEASELLARDDVVRLKRCIFAQGTGYSIKRRTLCQN